MKNNKKKGKKEKRKNLTDLDPRTTAHRDSGGEASVTPQTGKKLNFSPDENRRNDTMNFDRNVTTYQVHCLYGTF